MKEMISRPISFFSEIAAKISLIGGATFAVLLGLLHLLEPEFDPSWRFVSEYQLGTFGWMMHLAFFALALSLASAAIALWQQARNVIGYIGNSGLLIAAIGILLAGFFTTDPIQTSPQHMTMSGQLHVFGASLDYTPVAMLLLGFSLSRSSAWRPIRKWLFTTAAISLVCMVAFMFTLPPNGTFGPDVHAGLMGRILLLSYLGWLFVVGLHVIKLRARTA